MKAVAHAKIIALDTSIFIYQFEDNPFYQPITEQLFKLVENKKIIANVSALAYSEILVIPFRTGDFELVTQYKTILQYKSDYFKMILPDFAILELAAELRARYRFLELPDAIHLANAIATESKLFITNDRKLTAIHEIPVLVLENYL